MITKNYLFIIALLAGWHSLAQPIYVLTPDSYYSVISHSVGNDEVIPIGPAGENQIWDCSSYIISSLYGNNTIIPVETAPGHEQFPLANYCLKNTSPSFNPPLETYSFSKITSVGAGECCG